GLAEIGHIISCRLSDAQAAMISWHRENSLSTLTFRQTGLSDSVSFRRQVQVSGSVKHVVPPNGRRELLVTTKDATHVMGTSSGEHLRKVKFSFDFRNAHHALGSVWTITQEAGRVHHLMDTQIGHVAALPRKFRSCHASGSRPHGSLRAGWYNRDELAP